MIAHVSMLQFRALVKKNFLLALRSKELFIELVIPIALGLLIIFQKYMNLMQLMSPFIFSMSIAAPARSLLISLVEEQSQKYKEIQKIMGLKESTYITAWLCTSYIRALSGSLIFILTLSFGNIEELQLKGLLYLALIVYSFAITNFAVMISCFFSSPKLAGEIGTLLLIISGMGSFLGFNDTIGKSPFYMFLVGMFPSASIALGYICSQQTMDMLMNAGDYSIYQCIFQLSFEAFLYLLIYVYLDQVMPNQYGVSKHPCFFLNIFQKGKQFSTIEKEFDYGQDWQGQMDSSSAKHHQHLPKIQENSMTVLIQNLTMQFGDLVAVDDISMILYEKSHNGAGKTTTINLLTGMLKKSEGKVTIYGRDLDSEMEEIRQSVGICNQKDVLYNHLTFHETLRFFGQIQGVDGLSLDNEIQYIYQKTGTIQERDQLVSELSGGNQRKLSLGCALIGGSKLIFFDEPTSGMDAVSRKKIWEILHTLREENRTIVLTTHHLDEAEELANRIGIMSKGKLLALGTNEYIKKKFGIGYRLRTIIDKEALKSMNLNFEREQHNINQLVQIQIDEAVQNYQSSDDTLLFTIPFKAQRKLVNLFWKLDQCDFLSISLEMNTLEQAFINISFEQQKQRAFKNAQGVNNTRQLADLQRAYDSNNRYSYVTPQCLQKRSTYQFQSQLTAVFLRKYYFTVRNYVNWISFAVSITILSLGACIVNFVIFPQYMPQEQTEFIRLFFLSIFYTISFCFSSTIYIILPVWQRQHNLKYALNVMGCRVLPYWLGTFLFDYLLYIFITSLGIAVSIWFNYQLLIDLLPKLALIFLIFGFSFISNTYLMGFMFKKSNTAISFLPIFNILSWSLTWSIIGILDYLNQNNHMSAGVFCFLHNFTQILAYFFSPFWTFNMSLLVVKMPYNQVRKFNYFSLLNQEWYYFAFVLLIFGAVYVCLTYFYELKSLELQQKNEQKNLEKNQEIPVNLTQQLYSRTYELNLSNIQNNDNETGGDQFVEDQRKRIMRLSEQSSDSIQILNLQKIYENNFTAIKNVSVSIRNGEIFGLLGPNGAGKSTTFNILTCLIPQTSGSVKIKGTQVKRELEEIYQDVGICPQFDCLWEHLTPIEHLFLFGRMKGLQSPDLDESVDYFINVTQLNQYADVKAGLLSGGNKRQLCVANALIGGPDIQFFDEPTTGVDPIARRFLWNTINLGLRLRNASICLTTHTMEQAQSLCTKIGILINGEFKTIGSPQQLRDKYGAGYTITIKTSGGQEFYPILARVFPNLKSLPRQQQGYFSFQIPKNQFNFYSAFRVCQIDLKESNIIQDFSIKQSSLEEVFIYFSLFQKETGGYERNIENQNYTSNYSLEGLIPRSFNNSESREQSTNRMGDDQRFNQLSNANLNQIPSYKNLSSNYNSTQY